MMLTGNTAESLGVMDRFDPTAAIGGGACYLADRHRRLPDSIPEPGPPIVKTTLIRR